MGWMSQRLRAAPEVVARPFGAELLLLHFGSARFFSLCPTGRVIWNEIMDGSSVAETAEHLSALFRLDCSQFESDLRDFYAALRDAGLVTSTPETSRSGPAFGSPDWMPASYRYSKPQLLCLGHIREFTYQPFRPDQLYTR